MVLKSIQNVIACGLLGSIMICAAMEDHSKIVITPKNMTSLPAGYQLVFLLTFTAKYTKPNLDDSSWQSKTIHLDISNPAIIAYPHQLFKHLFKEELASGTICSNYCWQLASGITENPTKNARAITCIKNLITSFYIPGITKTTSQNLVLQQLSPFDPKDTADEVARKMILVRQES